MGDLGVHAHAPGQHGGGDGQRAHRALGGERRDLRGEDLAEERHRRDVRKDPQEQSIDDVGVHEAHDPRHDQQANERPELVGEVHAVGDDRRGERDHGVGSEFDDVANGLVDHEAQRFDAGAEWPHGLLVFAGDR